MLKKIANKMLKQVRTKSLSELNFFYPEDNNYYKATAKDYKQNVIVHRCINLIANSASHVPWKAYRDTLNGHKIIENHPVNKILRQPNANIAGADFFTLVISNLLLYGNSYMLTNSLKKGQVSEIYALNPEYVNIILKDNKAVAYKYSSGNKEKIYPIDKFSKKSSILHIKNF